MGASEFIVRQKGASLQKAYKQAYDDAEEEYGHQQGYSGHINCTDGARDVTGDYKNSKKSLPKYMNDRMESCYKGQCLAICLSEPVTNKNKVKTTVEHIVNKGTSKWVLKYSVYEYDSPLKSFPTKGDAVKHARIHTEKTGRSTSVVMEKVLEKGHPTVALIKYKQSTKEKPGEWIFFGLAPS